MNAHDLDNLIIGFLMLLGVQVLYLLLKLYDLWCRFKLKRRIEANEQSIAKLQEIASEHRAWFWEERTGKMMHQKLPIEHTKNHLN